MYVKDFDGGSELHQFVKIIDSIHMDPGGDGKRKTPSNPTLSNGTHAVGLKMMKMTIRLSEHDSLNNDTVWCFQILPLFSVKLIPIFSPPS